MAKGTPEKKKSIEDIRRELAEAEAQELAEKAGLEAVPVAPETQAQSQTLISTPKEVVTVTGRKLAIVPVTDYAVMQVGKDTIAEIISSNLGGLGGITERDLPRIRIPTGGNLAWNLKTLEGDAVGLASIEGIIVHVQPARVYWRKPLGQGGGGAPPDCVSRDGLMGQGDPGGECLKCPLAEFGSKEGGRGQACKDTRLVFLLSKRTLLPDVVILPPTSIGAVKQYLVALAIAGIPGPQSVVTRLTLEKTKNQGGIEYAKAKFALVGSLSNVEHAYFKMYGDNLRRTLEYRVIELSQADVGEPASDQVP